MKTSRICGTLLAVFLSAPFHAPAQTAAPHDYKHQQKAAAHFRKAAAKRDRKEAKAAARRSNADAKRAQALRNQHQ